MTDWERVLSRWDYININTPSSSTSITSPSFPLRHYPLYAVGGPTDKWAADRKDNSTEERECTSAAGETEQRPESQTAGDGKPSEVQIQVFHYCTGVQSGTAGGAAGAGEQVRTHTRAHTPRPMCCNIMRVHVCLFVCVSGRNRQQLNQCVRRRRNWRT